MGHLSRTRTVRVEPRTRLARFSAVYSRSKSLGIAAACLWTFGLIEVGLADFFKLAWYAALGFAAVAVGVLSLVAYLYYKAGVHETDFGQSCSNKCDTDTSDGCSQPGCDSEGGGCLAKFDEELKDRIAQMEKDKLTQLLRRRFGVDLILPVFWIVVGAKLAMSSGPSSQIGGMLLVAGSLGMIATRIYLGTGVFS